MDMDPAISLPSYAEAVSDAADDCLPPVILVLDGQSIHAEADPAVPLYQVNRGIAQLGPATSVVEFARMERAAGTGIPRYRHIYNLRHVQPLLRALSAHHAEYFTEAVAAPTRRGLGHLGLQYVRTAMLTEHWTVLSVDMAGWAERDRPPFVADAKPVFEVHQIQGAYKWTDGSDGHGDGHDVAMEYDAAQEHPHQHRLLVTASLPRATLDALVALWCCRVWEKSVDRQRAQTVQTTHAVPIHGWKKFR